jgi:hypothetical protein
VGMSTGLTIVPDRPICRSPTWPPCASEPADALELPTGCSDVAGAFVIHEYETKPMAIKMTTACVPSRTSRNKERYPPLSVRPFRGVPLLFLGQASTSFR